MRMRPGLDAANRLCGSVSVWKKNIHFCPWAVNLPHDTCIASGFKKCVSNNEHLSTVGAPLVYIMRKVKWWVGRGVSLSEMQAF